MEGISFALGNYRLTFDDSIKEYMEISKEMDEFSRPLITELKNSYKKLENIESVHNQFLNIGEAALEKVAEQAIKICSRYGIYGINAERILNANDFQSSAMDTWLQCFSTVDNVYIQIESKAAAEKGERELRKEMRMRLVGGGFGLTGAAKGMLQAGAINMLTGAAYDFVNMFGNNQSDAEASKNKDVLYQAKETLYTLQFGFAVAANIIKQELLLVVGIKPFEDNNIEKAALILENIKKGNIEKPNIEDALVSALLLNPFDSNIYTAYFVRLGDINYQLEEMAKFFNLYDFVHSEKKRLLLAAITKEFKLDEDNGDVLQSRAFRSFGAIVVDIRDVLLGTSAPVLAFKDMEIQQIKLQVAFTERMIKAMGLLRDQYILFGLEGMLSYIKAVEKAANKSIEKQSLIFQGDEVDSYEYFRNSEIKELTIPSNIQVIRRGAFAECSSLKNVVFEDGTESVLDAAFAGSAVKIVKFPSTLKTIGMQAFADCKNLEHVELPDGLVSIEKGAFENCSNLKEISVPNSVTEIGEKIFGKTSIKVLCSPGSAMSEYCKGEYLYTVPGLLTNKQAISNRSCVVIGDGFTRIDNKAFADNLILHEVTIPSNIKEIGREAFSRCENLKKVLFIPGVEKIEGYAFASCSALKDIVLPNTIKDIGEGVFAFCHGLKKVYVPEGTVSLASDFVDFTSVEMVILPESLQEIYSVDFDTGERYVYGDPRHECGFKEEKIRFVCKPGTYAYQYCKDNGLNVDEDERAIKYEFEQAEDLQEEKVNDAVQNRKESKGEFGTKDYLGCLFWIVVVVLIIRWLFF